MQLEVKIRVNPPPSQLSLADFDKLTDGELSKFNNWFLEWGKKRGSAVAPLVGVEKGILKTYLLFLYTSQVEEVIP